MSRIPQTFLDDLLNRLDIVEVIDKRVKLKRAGKNYSACCPFHEEKTPSFSVSPDKQFYYCFGCGATGTAISFLMEYERIGFVDAVDSLAKTAGVEVPRETSQHDANRDRHRKQCYETLEKASNYYQEQLKHHRQRHSAVKYLQNRGLSGQIAKIYGLGFSPPGWDNLILQLGQNESALKLLLNTGLSIEKPEEGKRYDRFRNRIMFPIRDGRGRTIGFGGRVLGDDKPKYLNSPETDVFSKGRELYGLHEAKKHSRNLEQLIVVEGYMDVIALAQYGLWNAVATLGTACGEEHLTIAFRHVSEVVFCFDGDNAGRKAAKRALMSSLAAMEDGRQIRFLFLPDGHDPDSLVRQIGADRFKAQVKKALPLEDFLFDVAADGIDLNSMDGRARFSKMAAPLIHQIPEGIFRSLMLENLAKRTGLSLEILSSFTQVPEELTQNSTPEPETERAPTYTQTANIADYHDANAQDAGVRGARLQGAAIQTIRVSAPRSQLTLNPARNAILLLLDHPRLVQDCKPEIKYGDQTLDSDQQNLIDLMAYLKKRPEANFNNIMGFWGGSKGVDAQQALAKLIANHVLSEVKQMEIYDAQKEFEACITAVNSHLHLLNSKQELAELQAKGLSELSQDEKRRYTELIRST